MEFSKLIQSNSLLINIDELLMSEKRMKTQRLKIATFQTQYY